MLDINYVRKYGDVVRKSLETRKDEMSLKLLDDLLKTDEAWRKSKQQVDQLRSRRNIVSQEINKKKKAGGDASALIKEAADIPKKLEEFESSMDELHEKMRYALMRIPNVLHPSVPYGQDDTQNVEVAQFGKKPVLKNPVSHVDLLSSLDIADLERAAKVSGSRWFFLKNELVLLDLALQRYALDFMMKLGFTPIVPPFMVSRRAVESATSLGDFEEAIYKVQDEDLYMIPTSEHPLIAQFMGEVLEEKDLPIKLVGVSSCFRKEAGAHGKDQKGIFRVHQFNKVEQVVVCSEAESWHWHEQLLKHAVEFFESLGLHGRIVNICTGDIGIVAAKKYDIEVWFPVQDAYREVVSCSNCTEYQAVRANIRYQQGQDRKWAHTLNSTTVATTRAMAAILENFQRPDGLIEIPKVLHEYCGFKEIKR